ncbi:Isocitrate dehydrogenase [NADP], mitochondrial [Seminavis robusta]|uniref:Isocitrate dehydrogenase [NADP], mitochondrial n=1 Tax=Seminavis robusta TaxID=568900 RepID=A0A9N8E206_9STRA|nr:Isocitrate dehydrogenase [NADP], mitochondrial [Seminavis robusta]|eukprot:Sro450_g145550.1 Isocitrate dehydrogenase [NADP], mitochondrial (555) ;mRNA; f:29470-31313
MASRLALTQFSRRALGSSRVYLGGRVTTTSIPSHTVAAKIQAPCGSLIRWNSTSVDDSLSLTGPKVVAPPMVYIAGEEMTHYASNLIVEKWIKPYFDTTNWEEYDLSCKARDESDDQVLKDAVDAGKRIGAIFKEPTITPTAVQVKEMGLSKPFGSPNGAMRRGWNGITISRDTIHIEGIELGYKRPVFFERHAVGGEYGAGWNEVGQGTLLTTYLPQDGSPPFVVDKRDLTDEQNAVVVYHNPYDNIEPLAHLFFKRCLEADITPYIVTKKTVFKWQEPFWANMKKVFDEHYKEDFVKAGLMEECGGELQHLISDAATMKLIRWTGGGFGMAAHNYDGDMLTDQIAQVHRSPGFITSNLVGKNDDGSLIKEFEASHGTVSDLWHEHLAGKETSLNPLGMAEAMIGAMEHAATLDAEKNPEDADKQAVKAKIFNYCTTLRSAMHNTFRYKQGTRDMSGPSGFTTEDFIDKVAWRLNRYLAQQTEESPPPTLHEPSRQFRRNYDVDLESVNEMFVKFDKNSDGVIDIEEFTDLLVHLNLAPTKTPKAKDKTDEIL